MINYAFKTINLNKVWREVFSNNEVVNVYKKLILSIRATTTISLRRRTTLDCFMLGLLKDEWLKKEAT